MKRKRFVVCSALLVFVVAVLLIIGHKNTIVCKGSLDETTQMMFVYLGVSEKDVYAKNKTPASSRNSPLYSLIDYVFHISMRENPSLKQRVIVTEHEYNIFGTGSMKIRFDIVPVDDTHTRVTVRFNDSGTGIFPPFWWNPGIILRYRIANSINRFSHETYPLTNELTH